MRALTGVAELAAVLTAPIPANPQGLFRRGVAAAVGLKGSAVGLCDPAAHLSDVPRLPMMADGVALGVDFVLALVPPEVAARRAPWPAMVWHLRVDGGHDDLPGLRQAAHARRTMAVEVIATGGGLAAERLLHRAVLKTRRSVAGTLAGLTEAAPGVLLGAYRRAWSGALPPAGDSVARELPQASVFRAAIGQIDRTLRGGAARLFVRDVWNIGIIEAPIETILAGAPLPSPRWLQAPRRGRFHADPFPLHVDGRPWLLFEMFDEAEGRGWIAATELAGLKAGSAADAPVALDLGCHMSYPAVFEFGEATYCVPELSALGGLHLYRMGATCQEWTEATHVLPGHRLLDPTLFPHENRWWLLATLEGPFSDTDLYAWHAPTPLGDWTAHPLNPIKSDAGSARPAGAVFRARGGLYRPAQDCVKGYGAAVAVNRVLRLDPTVFEETEVARIVPHRTWPYPDGVHTLNVCAGGIVIDAKRRETDPFAPLRRMARRIRHRAARPM